MYGAKDNDLRDISTLTKDEFKCILSPMGGSSEDGKRVKVRFESDVFACCKVIDSKLVIQGSDKFRRTVEQAYASAKPTMWFGSAEKERPKPEYVPVLKETTQKPLEEVFDVGFFWNDAARSKDAVYEHLYGSAKSTVFNFQHRSMFDQHNKHLNDVVRAGEIVIVVQHAPKTLAEKDRLLLLKTQAEKASTALKDVDVQEAQTLFNHFDVFDFNASQVSQTSSAAFGAASTVIGTRIEQLTKTLKRINDHYVQHMTASQGSMKNLGADFYVGRMKLFQELDNSLEKFTIKTVKIPVYDKLKNTLGLSTKSALHNWREVSSKGMIPALGDRIEHLSTYVKGAKNLGYVGLAIDSTIGAKNTYQACTVGSDEQCAVTGAKEVGTVLGSWFGGSVSTVLGANAAVAVGSGILIGFGVVASAPVVAVLAIGGGVVGGYFGGSAIGEATGAVAEKTAHEIIRMVKGNDQ